MIAICVPSRGLIFSRTVECVIKGMQALGKLGIESDYFTSHDLPIPDSHISCVEQVLANSKVDKILFIEEDNVLFLDAFMALATSEKPITLLQYNDKNGSPHGIIHYNNVGEILWGGLGAVCIKREVFEKIGKPYFRIDHRYKIVKKQTAEDGRLIVDYEEIEPIDVWDSKQNKFVKRMDPYAYGGLDIDFYTRARKIGYSIAVLPEYKAHHLQLIQLGEAYTNQGVHVIRQV